MASVRELSQEIVLDIPKYIAARQRIGYSGERACTDGLCCFLADSAAVTKPRTDETVLIQIHITADINLEGILHTGSPLNVYSLNTDSPHYREAVPATITR